MAVPDRGRAHQRPARRTRRTWPGAAGRGPREYGLYSTYSLILPTVPGNDGAAATTCSSLYNNPTGGRRRTTL
ncbi:hypothetical protein [Nonomuraea rubra]|uniref:hypothetical protein n=1 Tax=Nonomuraea rubra TaxID=46180 RepID=UPI0031F1BE1A